MRKLNVSAIISRFGTGGLNPGQPKDKERWNYWMPYDGEFPLKGRGKSDGLRPNNYDDLKPRIFSGIDKIRIIFVSRDFKQKNG